MHARLLAPLFVLGLLGACAGRSQDHGRTGQVAGTGGAPTGGGAPGAGTGGSGASGAAGRAGGTGGTVGRAGEAGSGAGGTQASGGVTSSGGAGGSGSDGGASSAGAAGDSAGQGGTASGMVSCFTWDDVKNEPKPGETGVSACPGWSEIQWNFALPKNCVIKANQAPVAAVPGGETGDCCYQITYYQCR